MRVGPVWNNVHNDKTGLWYFHGYLLCVFLPSSNVWLSPSKTQELYLSPVWFSWVQQKLKYFLPDTELYTGDTGGNKGRYNPYLHGVFSLLRYSFSKTTITNHHKLSSSKQHKFIIPQFCMWEKSEHSVAQLIPLLRSLRCQNQGIHSAVFSSADCREEYVFLIIQAIGRI